MPVPVDALLLLLVLLLLTVWLVIITIFRATLLQLWREPVLRHPVLIIESDDWGPGPAAHARALERVCALLGSHRDATGRSAVMTIGTVLAVPDTAAIRASGFSRYARRTLLEPEFAAMHSAILRGRGDGVLAIQLHGLEHLWPPALMHAAGADGAVRLWIESGDGTDTELLPSHMQSRWADASVLPSRSLPESEIVVAVRDEAAVFRECFGVGPEVVVPPTFIWNSTVERAWAENDVRALVTPGRRLTGRDAEGRPAMMDRRVWNGDASEGGMTCLVRDVYFEPARGHSAQRALRDVIDRFRLGRPALLETHRFNFTGQGDVLERSLSELDALLAGSREAVPALRFMSSAELAQRIRVRDRRWVSGGLPARTMVWLRRAARLGRLRKLAWATGLALPAGLAYLVLLGAVRWLEPAHAGPPT